MAASDRELVAVVTGASRGIGKGIALELGAAGATVYVTGRSTTPSRALPGSLEETVKEIEALGGRGIPVACDHHDDDQVRTVFSRVADEQGRLDVLVNNVFSSPDLAPFLGKRFWELPLDAWDQVVDIGARSHYVATALAVPLLRLSDRGLVVNVSSPGSRVYMHSVPYGAGKAALDKLTHDMGHELKGEGVAVVSIWPGIVRTEFVGLIPANKEGRQILMLPGEGPFDLADAETPRFAGRAVVALAGADDRMDRSGRTHWVADLAEAYGFTDVDGRVPRAGLEVAQ
jgi:dehydrogenase/reductase SDR family member 1